MELRGERGGSEFEGKSGVRMVIMGGRDILFSSVVSCAVHSSRVTAMVWYGHQLYQRITVTHVITHHPTPHGPTLSLSLSLQFALLLLLHFLLLHKISVHL